MSRRVVITGMGWVTPLGHDTERVWQALLSGASGVRPTTVFDASTFPTTFAAEVKDFDLAAHLAAEYETHECCSRQTGFALAAAKTAWHDSGLDRLAGDRLDPTMLGVYLGSGEGPLDFHPFASLAVDAWDYDRRVLDTKVWGQYAPQRLDPVREREQDPNMACSHLAYMFNAQGPSFNTLTACAASTQAIGEASELIGRGDANAIITGGCHSMIHPFGVTGFNRLTALSTRNDSCLTASRPFDRERDGFVLGEGAGILILESLDHAQARGARIHGEIRGYGSTADAFRITDVHEEGRGPIAAMRGALAEAGLQPEDIDYVSAHGTATEENDKIETLSLRAVFAGNLDRLAISSLKSMVGHLIAAAGVVELMTCLLAIRDGIVPPTMHLQTPDPQCDLDYVPNEARKMPVERAMSNSFGFGGQNDSLIVQRFVK